MYKSQFWKMDTYDWFCGPGSRITESSLYFLEKVTHISWTETEWAAADF